tara:strand:- start:263 stop:622 length:360 start_codon:yes stop_codon:yes gene_type:complete
MNDKTKRMILFLSGCMGSRIGLTYMIKKNNPMYKQILLCILVITAFSFGYIYINDLRKTGVEVFGDKIWWNNLRPFHSIMYFSTAVLLYINNKYAYYPIAFDTIVGLIEFTKYHLGFMI